ncbi:MAG: hypothetical protein AABY00_02945 [Nanoarchaeota archaeon]
MSVKNLVLGIGIFIIYLLMLSYGIEAFYPSPQYEDFCKSNEFGRYPFSGKGVDTATNCTFSKTLQEQNELCYSSGGFPVYQYSDVGCTTAVKECNFCNKYYNESQRAYSKIVFIIALILGIITFLAGYGIFSVEPVSSALIASGIGAIFYGSVRNWENLSDILRFLLLFVALVLLIWITLRTNKIKKHAR